MADRPLQFCNILIVEDEYLLADDLSTWLRQAGAQVLGPVASVADATAIVHSRSRIDAVVLDVNLGGEMVFPLADLLTARGIPVVFATGYDQSAMPLRFAAIPRAEKPLAASRITATLMALMERPD